MKRASPDIVVEMDERALVLRFRRREARDEVRAAAGGEPLLFSVDVAAVGGRWEDQSWTKRDTLGLCRRFCVLRDCVLVVIKITGSGVLLFHE